METIDDIGFYFNYKSPIGVFIIQFDISKSKWALGLNGIIHGYYSSPVAAADDVFSHVTGAYEWDSMDISDLSTPTDIYEWEKYQNR